MSKDFPDATDLVRNLQAALDKYKGLYKSACKGRSDFRQALRKERERVKKVETAGEDLIEYFLDEMGDGINDPVETVCGICAQVRPNHHKNCILGKMEKALKGEG